jgi:hypothetical protein
MIMDLPINKIICGDCREVIKDWPDGCIDTIITDPPWWNCKIWPELDAIKLFAETAPHIKRLCHRAIIILGYGTDPGPLHYLNMPFVRVCYLRYARPNYAGRLLGGSEFAYVYGDLPRPSPGQMVLGGECVHTGYNHKENGHPCERTMTHTQWLVDKWTNKEDVILDPFCGSGTTLVAAKKSARPFIGIEINPDYCKISEERLTAVETGVPRSEAKKGQGYLYGKDISRKGTL